jgi:hypothetical protein
MASELADAILKRVSPIGNDLSNGELTSAIDAELQEVREVLNSLRQSRDCWCVATWKGAHDGRCQRARALMEKLTCR